MTSGTPHLVTNADGPAALPRSNGELVFQAPWESRAFGVAVALHDAGAIDYEDFRSRLIREIAAHADRGAEDGGAYYERWLDALQQMLVERGIVSAEEIGKRTAEIAHAWDHEHEHEHEHEHGHIDQGEAR